MAAALRVAEHPRVALESVVHDRLREGRTLLVLDNCEHVLDPVATFVQGVLARCPDTVVVATSRERLGVPGERLVELRPLGADAETLFVDRAAPSPSGADRDPALVAEICRRLDGVPLAIELAAARSGSLGIDGLLAGLDDHLRLLSRSTATGDRHRSLRAVIDWSHDLLDEHERRLFRRLGVFSASFDLDSVVAVAADGPVAAASDVVGRLTDKSLLVHVPDAEGSRWRMLDTVHAYAREQLGSDPDDDRATRRRHLAWAAATAQDLEHGLDDEGTWFARFDLVADDLRVALAGTSPGPEADRASFDLALALGHLTYARGFVVEALGHCDAAVARAPDDAAARVAGLQASQVAFAGWRGPQAFDYLMGVGHSAEKDGDRRAAALALAGAATIAARAPAIFAEAVDHERIVTLVERARALAPADDLEVSTHIAVAAAWNGRPGPTEPDPDLADEALALARRLDDPVLISSALDAVCSAAEFSGRLKASSKVAAERLGLLDRLPRHDPRVGGEVVDIFHMATESAIAAGDLPAALAAARRAHGDRIDKGLPYLSSSRLVVPLVLQGEFDDALMHAAAMRESWERAGRPTAGWMGSAVLATALVHGLRGDQAAHEAWLELARLVGGRALATFGTFVEQRVDLHLGHLDRALAVVGAPTTWSRGYDAFACAIGVEVAVAAGAPDAERLLAATGELAAENDFVAASLARAAGRLRGDEGAYVAAVDLWEAIGARFERACTLLLIPSRADEGRRELDALGCPLPLV